MRFDPIGGGQFKNAVKQIMDAEKQPVKALEARKAQEETRVKLFSEFKAKFAGFEKTLSEFTDFKKFRELKVDLGDGTNQVGVTFDKEKAEPGSYQMEISDLAARSSIISNGFKDPDEKNLGIGFITLDLPGGHTAEVFIDDENASLKGIAKAINTQKDSPVQASVIKDVNNPDKPWRLIMSSKKDGTGDEITFPDFYFMDGAQDLYIDDTHESQNAFLKMDGFEIESEHNDIKDFLDGVNLHLKQAKPDQPFTMTITQDYQKIAGKMKGLVDQVNGILEFINKQNQIDDKSDTKTTFAGDTSLQTVEYRLRNILHEGFPVYDNKDDPESYRLVFLNQMGVEFEKTGQLSFKEDKFTKVLENDFSGIGEGITGEKGFAAQMRQIIAGYTKTGTGLLSTREEGMRNRIKSIDKEIEDKTRRLESKEEALTQKFARLSGTLSAMQQQGQALSASLPSGGGGNLVSQLLGGGG